MTPESFRGYCSPTSPERSSAVPAGYKLTGRQTEKEAQMAKEIYEALNEQLTTELPQLIDLRVPYLDPSFEALVKIQLRCTEVLIHILRITALTDWGCNSLCGSIF